MRCPVCHRRLVPGTACPLHAERPRLPREEPEPLAPPQVPGFPLLAPLGAGGFAQVFSARREQDGTEVAVKVALAPSASPRFAHEAAALRRVAPPTAPALLGQGELPGGRAFLVLERLRGQTLAAWMAALPGSGAASLPHVRELLSGLCTALEHVHGVGLVHRDLKPENLFLREGGALSLLDFGLARFLDAPDARESEASVRLTRTGERLGTPFYMSPEQCLASPDVDARADLYALGVLLFELLTGAPPFTGEPDEVRRGQVSLRPPLASERAAVPRALDDVLLRCLAKEPAARFASASALLAAFDTACRTAPTPSAAPELPRRPAPSQGVRPVALLGVAGDVEAPWLAAAVSPEGGLLARVHPGRYLVAFPEHPSAEAGLRAALRAARSLSEPGVSTVLHLAPLRVRPGVSQLRLAGEALDTPDTWWPREGLTPEAARTLGEGAAAPGPEGAPTEAEPPPLLGRDALLDTLCADAARAFSGPGPGLTVLTGEPGLGKTRVLDALATRLEAEPGVRVVRLAAPPPDSAPGDALLHALWDTLAPPLPFPAPTRRQALARAVAEGVRQSATRGPLAVLLDDAHQADPTTLDVLEVATLAAPDITLWVCAAARPELRGLRPLLGERAGHLSHQALPPLAPEAQRALLRHLLRPAEFIPEPVLARLEQLTQGVPLSLVEVARALRTSGALRATADGEGYVAADELLHVSVTPLFERLAARALAVLPEAHQGLARLCAVLGQEVTVARVDAAQRHLEKKEDVARMADLDAGTGLARLERAGLLRAVGPGRHAFRQPQLREALERALPPALRRALHTAALRALPEGDTEPRARARHAAASGAHEEAFAAWFTLGEAARRAHRHVEAEQDYTHALAQLPEGDRERRARVLAGRGRVRYRTHRFHEALADLGQARALAHALGDTALEVDLLLEEATLVDWLEDAEGSAVRTREALEKAEALDDPRLSVRCSLARARQSWREGDWARATRLLTATVEAATLARDTETRIIALMMQGTGLALDGQEAPAAAAFDEALALSQREGDALHRAATLINRTFLWRLRGDLEGTERDLREAIALGRELGHAQVERWSVGQLSECLHWMGRDAEALGLARRAHELGVRFFGAHPVAVDAVLLARVALALGDAREARALLDWLDAHCSPEQTPPNTRALWRLVALRVREVESGTREAAAWHALADEAAPDTSGDELTEVLHQAALAAWKAEARDEARQWLVRARDTARASPLWRARLDALAVDWEATPTPETCGLPGNNPPPLPLSRR
ncbi:serine/threonine-protein kinase PknK [Cystobacter ferrugineus]|uniref:Serine/threonine-protein kinase PknK n=2 Tax=Cystobacter ferrugineus TaxID=83449 RepID=A0A1L9B124_9BACT|nr:serine/threonine-protein kinase [Cystobacter ferrugineus]OJH35955.1 serine/threonine-protein kinase PknK [Cystobacter ferrugineus]